MEVNANGSVLTPALIRWTLGMLALEPDYAITSPDLGTEWIGRGFKTVSEFVIETQDFIKPRGTALAIAGIPLRLDSTLSPNRLEFRDAQDRVLASIENIGMPTKEIQ